MSRPRIRAGWALILTIGMLVAGCGDELAPRRTVTDGRVAEIETFESPRRTVQVPSTVDPGGVEIPALVSGTDPVEVIAPGDGVIFDVRVESGDTVAAGQTVMSFLPAASRAEELELSILELRRELAVENADAAGIAAIDAETEALQAAWNSRSITIDSPAAGVVTGTRAGLERRVAEDRSLFTVSSPDDLAITALSVPAVVEPLALGDTVTVRRSVVGAPPMIAQVVAFDEVRDLVRTRFEFVDPPADDAIEVGDRVSVAFDVTDDRSVAATWVPADAVRRSDGMSYVLIERRDGGLERFDTDVQRRTDTHVLVGDPLERLVPGTVLVLP